MSFHGTWPVTKQYKVTPSAHKSALKFRSRFLKCDVDTCLGPYLHAFENSVFDLMSENDTHERLINGETLGNTSDTTLAFKITRSFEGLS